MPVDAKYIPDACGLLRRVTPSQIVPDANLGRRRLSSGAFRDRQLSVDAECLLVIAGLDWSFSLRHHPQFFLIRLRAGHARQHGQSVDHRPQADNEFHAEVTGQKSDSVRKSLCAAAEWVTKPDDV
jgi:hypothetical protein